MVLYIIGKHRKTWNCEISRNRKILGKRGNRTMAENYRKLGNSGKPENWGKTANADKQRNSGKPENRDTPRNQGNKRYIAKTNKVSPFIGGAGGFSWCSAKSRFPEKARLENLRFLNSREFPVFRKILVSREIPVFRKIPVSREITILFLRMPGVGTEIPVSRIILTSLVYSISMNTIYLNSRHKDFNIQLLEGMYVLYNNMIATWKYMICIPVGGEHIRFNFHGNFVIANFHVVSKLHKIAK